MRTLADLVGTLIGNLLLRWLDRDQADHLSDVSLAVTLAVVQERRRTRRLVSALEHELAVWREPEARRRRVKAGSGEKETST